MAFLANGVGITTSRTPLRRIQLLELIPIGIRRKLQPKSQPLPPQDLNCERLGSSWGMVMTEKYWYLKNCDLFERLSPERLRALESRCRTRKFPRNSPIYLPADHADGVLLMASGRAKICSFTSEGKQSILTFVEPGEMFGELVLFEPGERDEYAEAVVASKVVFIPADEMKQLLEENPSVALGVTRMIGMRRRRIERRLKYLLFHSNRERLAHLLLELAEDYGQESPGGVELSIRLSHQDLASIIGSTRETVTVILGELQAEGLVRLGRRRIAIYDVARLAQSVNGPVPRTIESGSQGPTNASSGHSAGDSQQNHPVFRS